MTDYETFRQKVRTLAEDNIPPMAMDLDLNDKFPREFVKQMADAGLMGLPYETEYEGAGADVKSYAIAVEELSRVDGGIGVILSAHTSLGTYPIAHFGNEEQKRKYLPDIASGRKLAAFGLTEENAGSDAGGTETTAVKDGDDYILNGRKIFITNAPEADTYVVFASTDPAKGTRGISAFIVEKDMPGFTFSKPYDKMGIRSSCTAELQFDNVRVPKENLLGLEGQGFKIAMATLDGGRIGIAAQALGIAQGAYEDALAYAKERVQFGAPIGRNQGISFKLADMATKLEAARLLVYQAAELKQAGKPYSKEAAMAKMYASDIALEVCNDALQIFGGSGYLKGMGVERRYRDAKITTIYEGTNEIQRVVIASHILGKMKKSGKETEKKAQMIDELSLEASVKKLVSILRQKGLGEPEAVDAPIASAKKILAIGQGAGNVRNAKAAEEAAKAMGFVFAGSRPAAEVHHFMGMDRYIGLSGQKTHGDLYIAAGISGAVQHLKGIEDVTTVVAINTDPNAPIFKRADYGIVGDMNVILPMLAKELSGQEPGTPGQLMVCSLCGYVYDPQVGDPENGVSAGTDFAALPADWVCPVCGATKDLFEPAEEPEAELVETEEVTASATGPVWTCSLCGYVYDGEVPFEDLPGDWTCPMCGATKDLFTCEGAAMEEAAMEEKEEGAPVWTCSLCGYVYDGEIPFEELPADWVCPVCGAGKDLFEKS